ncbi:hypothetical protein [Algoriphagus sp.]|uniref:hypothetical protein n=1 Tax=Algoriphagus sp. TaxID=1872435 RepID=UPI00391C2757
MAKTNEQFDQHFKEKLDGHLEKPSALAWDRLESQLPKESKPTFGIWWAVAASVTALLVAGYSFWPRETGISEEILLAEKTELPMVAPNEITAESTIETSQTPAEKIEPTLKSEVTPEIESTQAQPQVTSKTPEKTKPTPSPALSQAPRNLVAQAETETIKTSITVAVPELKTEEIQVVLPELKAPIMEKTIAQTAPEDDAPLYRVSIYSNGVKKSEPQEKNLITELGKTVSHVEGLLSKVDEGLISLQDKKDNLFASLTSKKNQADEKP